MPDKELLIKELSTLLREKLSPLSWMPGPISPMHGNLPLEMAYVRVEPWVLGFDGISERGAWQLASELALGYSRVPVLAYKSPLEDSSECWRFRVPLYMAGPDFEGHPEAWHDFSRTIALFADEFSGLLLDYQELRSIRADSAEMVKSVLGVDL
ncbi:hypothetical protein SPB21_03575 [Leptothoe sp. ISB3NOV94-8A]